MHRCNELFIYKSTTRPKQGIPQGTYVTSEKESFLKAMSAVFKDISFSKLLGDTDLRSFKCLLFLAI